MVLLVVVAGVVALLLVGQGWSLTLAVCVPGASSCEPTSTLKCMAGLEYSLLWSELHGFGAPRYVQALSLPLHIYHHTHMLHVHCTHLT